MGCFANGFLHDMGAEECVKSMHVDLSGQAPNCVIDWLLVLNVNMVLSTAGGV